MTNVNENFNGFLVVEKKDKITNVYKGEDAKILTSLFAKMEDFKEIFSSDDEILNKVGYFGDHYIKIILYNKYSKKPIDQFGFYYLADPNDSNIFHKKFIEILDKIKTDDSFYCKFILKGEKEIKNYSIYIYNENSSIEK
jgi:hypothetical protein